ncbi:MAG TPA: ATP-dependent Clp protease proteolytic subunit [Ruminococcus sp.]|nr:ATP-dependent Clp protease proteolytic subunit [Ruminococcus sp.]
MNDTLSIPSLRVPYEDNIGVHELDSRTAELLQGCVQIVGEINTTTAMQTICSLRFLAEKRQNVKILLNSNGGEISSGLAIIDAIRSYPYGVTVLCIAMAASMGAVILASCPRGQRLILPHGKVMIHEPLIAGGLGGSVTTIEKTAKSMIETRNIINGLLSECTGRSIEEIDKATSFDNYMSAKEAISFGICDAIGNPYI